MAPPASDVLRDALVAPLVPVLSRAVAPFDIAIAMLVAAGTSAALVYLLVRAAPRRLIDRPGFRRSHVSPTPRGGGVGPVAAIALVALGPWLLPMPAVFAAGLVAMLAVAGIGLADDAGNVAAWKRLLLHVAACALAVAPLLGSLLPGEPSLVSAFVLLAMLSVALAWSINLHNFMDGINGVLSLHAAFVCAAIALFAQLRGVHGLVQIALVAGAAVIAFVPFNLPRARVFLGDVGSGALGFFLAWLLLMAIAGGAIGIGTAIVLLGVFFVDATATLGSRALRGRRWWRPHREHLYQWLVRSGHSHARVALAYLVYEIAILLPLAWAAESVSQRGAGPANLLYSAVWPAFALALMAAVWWFGKRHLLRRARRRHR